MSPVTGFDGEGSVHSMTSKTAASGTGLIHTGKTASEENFPVGSLLLPAATRPCVAAFYAFARTADDVADDPVLSPDNKLVLLDGMDAALMGLPASSARTGPSTDLRRAMLARGLSPDQPRALLEAFRRDAMVPRCESWADLMDYCRYSAAPVGRFLLELHGEDQRTFAASDALCAALQILNHIQDCRGDYLALRRVYVPADWLAAEGRDSTALGEHAADSAVMRVLGKMLDGVDGLLARARPLPGRVSCRGLRLETAVILTLAERLAARLRGRDPLAARIGHAWYDWVLGAAVGLARGMNGR